MRSPKCRRLRPPTSRRRRPPTSPAMRVARGLAIKGVSHAFDDAKVVDDVHLTVAPGELVCLVGPSGCGKTTLLRIAAGLAELQRGAITIDDAVAAEPGRALPPEARGVGLVFQD